MRACTSNVHGMFYPNNDPLPDDEFTSDQRKGFTVYCRKCREYKRVSALKRKTEGPAYKRQVKIEYSPYDDLCASCVHPDCVRESGQDLPAHDHKYLDSCVLAVARHFKLKPANADEQIYVKNRVLRWQHLGEAA